MISIDHLLVDERVLSSQFACDVAKCKGACCTLSGGHGAPVLDAEVDDIVNATPTALKYLDQRSRNILAAQGGIEGHEGSYSTRCIDDSDCVYVFYENEIAKCALEKAYHNGEHGFRKPLSCHLFPIRIANFGGPYLYYDEFEECEPGRTLGAEIKLPLIEAVKDALVRAFGEETYERLRASVE